MSTDIAITGATGHIGKLVARSLNAQGVSLRLLVRNPSRAPALADAQTCVSAGYPDAEANRKALAGVETLFMVSAAEAPDRLAQHFAFIDAAAEAGVKQIVYTSFVGAAADATFTLSRDHWATEQHIIDAGLDHTFLRDNFYLDLLATFMDAAGFIRGPAQDGRVAGIARADVARAAAAVLRDATTHRGQTYDLTGPESLTLTEVAAIITETAGKQITFHNESVAEAYASRAVFDAPDWELDAWVSTYTAIAAGEMAALSPAVQELTGTAPMSLRELLSGR